MTPWRAWLAAAVLGVLAAGCSQPPATTAAGWRQVWAASFAGPAGQSPSGDWDRVAGPGAEFGTGEVERMTASPGNVHLDGHGRLEIVPLRARAGWTSGRVESRGRWAAPAGGQMQVAASVRQPSPPQPAGYWPAFWLLGDGRWPGGGEIDVMEDVNSDARSAGALHCGVMPGGPCHEPAGLNSGLRPVRAGWHACAVVAGRRRPGREEIRWLVDGRVVFAVTELQVGVGVWAAAVDHPFRVIFDVAVGGRYPDADWRGRTPTAQTTPGAALRVASVTVSYMS